MLCSWSECYSDLLWNIYTYPIHISWFSKNLTLEYRSISHCVNTERNMKEDMKDDIGFRQWQSSLLNQPPKACSCYDYRLASVGSTEQRWGLCTIIMLIAFEKPRIELSIRLAQYQHINKGCGLVGFLVVAIYMIHKKPNVSMFFIIFSKTTFPTPDLQQSLGHFDAHLFCRCHQAALCLQSYI